MTRSTTTAVLALVLLVGSVVVAGATVATTHAYFTDSETGQGSVVAADSFEDTGDGACVDENQNGQCDPGEDRIDTSDLLTYTNESADLVIPENVDDLDSGNNNIDITAESITSEVDLRTKNGDVDLNAGAGGIDLGGSDVTIDGGGGGVDIESDGDIDLAGSYISTKTKSITITASGFLNIDNAVIDGRESSEPIDLSGQRISARNAEITNKNGETILSARNNGGGELDATGATIESRGKNGKLSGGPITLESSGTMRLNQTALRVKKTATVEAYLDIGSATLYTDGTIVRDDDDALYYEPGSVQRKP